MTVRMWEARAVPGGLDALVEWACTVAVPAVADAHGFESAEVFRSDEQDRLVVITRWTGRTQELPEPPTTLSARPPAAWDFEPVTR